MHKLTPIMSLLTLLLYIIGNLFYYYGITSFISNVSQNSISKNKIFYFSIILFIINFSSFIIFAQLNLSIVKSWIMHSIFLFLECIIIFNTSIFEAMFISVTGCLCTITPMLLFKSIMSMLPIKNINFSILGHISWLSYPVCFAYMFSGLIFITFFGNKNLEAIKYLVSSWKKLKFIIVTNIILLIYILIQASFFDTLSNNIYEKLWAMFTCLFILFSYHSLIKYAIRTSYLYHINEQNQKMFLLLQNHKNEEMQLEKLVHFDELTGVLNRKAGQEKIQNLIDGKFGFTLCIIDLDGLKYVNDNLGHQIGDIYITSVVEILKNNYRADSDILFRYGGDEFIIAFVSSSFNIEERMQKIYYDVKAKSSELDIPMQISYGYEYTDGFADFVDVFKKADKNMYKMKMEHKKENPHLIRAT